MNIYTTEIIAVNPVTNELCKFSGPNVQGLTWQDADRYCQENELGYCKVNGLLISEIDEQTGIEVFYNQQILN